MKSSRLLVLFVACAAACGSPAAPSAPDAPPAAFGSPSPPADSGADAPIAITDAGAERAAPAGPPPSLEVRFLGVAGFLLTRGDEAVLTAPLYTRPSEALLVTVPTVSDATLVTQSLPASALTNVRALVSGHAHYDHLIDAPTVLANAPRAKLFGNATGKHILAALAPDRDASCAGTPAPSAPLPRDRIVAMDDETASLVDYTGCPEQRPAGAPLEGTWLRVPGAHVRLLAVCSEHPDQLGPIHFAPGSVDADLCAVPPMAADWREGRTIAFLIDFLDPVTDAPAFRVYYQDAPTNVPVGTVPASILADKQVDLALLCVGNYDRVNDAPGNIVATLTPRFALGGHWEDFFRPATDPPQPLPLLDTATWETRAAAALPPGSDVMLRNGAPAGARGVLPVPDDTFVIAPR